MQGRRGMVWSVTIVPDDPPGHPQQAPQHMTTSEPFASGISQYVEGITAHWTQMQIQILALPRTCCLTLGKFLELLSFSFLARGVGVSAPESHEERED